MLPQIRAFSVRSTPSVVYTSRTDCAVHQQKLPYAVQFVRSAWFEVSDGEGDDEDGRGGQEEERA